MEELCSDGSRRRVVTWAKCIQNDRKIQLRVYRTNRNQTYRYSQMIDEYVHAIKSGNEPLYPYAFIEQHGTSTKRFIDDILTISLGSQTEGPTFEHIIEQQGNIYGGM